MTDVPLRGRQDDPTTLGGQGLDRDRGAILLLTIGYVLIAVTLVIVVVDVSAFFLSRRALAALADGAAVAGTSAEDGRRLYGSGPGAQLPLDALGVRSAVSDYLIDRDAGTAYPHLQVREVTTDGGTVSVVLTEDKPLPFLSVVNSITGTFPGGTAQILVAAHARAPITP